MEAEGFVDIETWLTEAPVELPPGELESYLRTVILSGEVARRTPEDADELVHAVAVELGEPAIDYVRLNILARKEA
jgi:trans-aconitate 2-methyltransferase